MGLFLSMSAVVDADKDAVAAALSKFAQSRDGSCHLAPGKKTEDPNTLVLFEQNRRSTIVYPGEFFDWDAASQFLSAELKTPVFSFHIHDGDLWTFIAFADGEPATQFNPVPDYWDSSNEEACAWAGNAVKVASLVPDVDSKIIEPYLTRWNFEPEEPKKAWPDDEFATLDCWQLLDFMRRLGFKYPIGNSGSVLGETYEFVPEEPDV